MLVLRTKIYGKVIVQHAGEQLEITLVELQGNAARLGFSGPKSFIVDREEIYKDKLKGEKP